MGIKFSNNASANIIRALTSTATSVSVTAGKGALFPSLTEGDYFYATLAGNKGLEIVKVTNRVNDTMTIVRAQDNTTALSFDTGDLFELRIVAADFNDTFSEVNDKLEASIEETTSIVNSALSNKAPVLHASSSTEYGSGSSEQYGHLKSHDAPDATKTAATGHAFSPAGAAAMQETLEEQIGNLSSVVSGNAAAQTAKDASQDEAINSKVSTVNGLTPDSNGNVDVGGMPLGSLIPYTGKDVPAGTLRADGNIYTNMRASFPEFYEWVVNSGLTVPLTGYTLIEGSCGYYGLDASTGTVRMPTLAAGVFGTTAAGRYGQAVEAGLPDITGSFLCTVVSNHSNYTTGAFRGIAGSGSGSALGSNQNYGFDFYASRSNPIYGRSNTVTPSHVKYPWVIVVYNAAVPPSVAQAGEFIGLLDGKADKTQLDTVVAPGFVMPFAANSTPEGYLLCNGAAVSRTTYATLFSVIGTTYGAGDGWSTFTLPNLTDRFIQGHDAVGVYREAGLPDHTHFYEHTQSYYYNSRGIDCIYTTVFRTDATVADHYPDQARGRLGYASASNGYYGRASTVQPAALTMRYYIKY